MHYAKNPILPELLKRSKGQTAAIEVLNDAGTSNPFHKLFTGPYPAGVDETISEVINNITSPDYDPHHSLEWIFLIGAPGNGKSKAGQEFLDTWVAKTSQDHPVRTTSETGYRSTKYSLSDDLDTLIINDASVQSEQLDANTVGPLFKEIKQSFDEYWSTEHKKPTVLFANVNRGKLIEECNKVTKSLSEDRDKSDKAASAILDWLCNHETQNPYPWPEITDLKIKTACEWNADTPYYASVSVNLTSEVKTIVIHSVFLDSLSILEKSPQITFEQNQAKKDPYQPIGGLKPPNNTTRDTTIFGQRVKKLTSKTVWEAPNSCGEEGSPEECSAKPICPFFQNARWLRQDGLREQFLSTFRGIEIASGKRFTYRDLWAYLSISILGIPEDDWILKESPIHPCDWVRLQNENIYSDGQADDQAKITSVISIFTHRIYYNLFNTGLQSQLPFQDPTDTENNDKTYAEVKRSFNKPVSSYRSIHFDTGINLVDPSKSTNKRLSQVQEAIESINEHNTECSLNTSLLPYECKSEIEVLLDREFRNQLKKFDEPTSNSNSEYQTVTQRRAAFYQWRFIALARQIGLANSESLALSKPIEAWLSTHQQGLRATPSSRQALRGGLKKLICGANNEIVLDPMQPRTMPVINQDNQHVYIKFPESIFNVTAYSEGEKLFAKMDILGGHSSAMGFPIDITMAREALIMEDSSGNGFSNINPANFARIERARSRIIKLSKDVAADMEITFKSESGVSFRVNYEEFEQQFRIEEG